MKLSVGIITLNEEKILGKTLEAVKDIADEIIIVDSGSTDKTTHIAKEYGAKVSHKKWEGFGAQKNHALSLCQGEWILLLDADEVASPELILKIKEIINDKNQKNLVYEINRASVCFGKEIKHGGWSNQYATRLWANGKVKLGLEEVHESYNTSEKKAKLKEKLYHYSYLSLGDYLERFNKYTSLGAKEYRNRGKKANFFSIFFNPIYKFIKMYFIRGGFLDGKEGLLLAILSSNYTMVKYYKLLELNRCKKEEDRG